MSTKLELILLTSEGRKVRCKPGAIGGQYRIEVLTQTLKPDLFSSNYVRPNARCGEVGRTLQKLEFFRSL
jgi:hypothetical protein